MGVRISLFGDERLARLVEGGSERAFAGIYERYHRSLYRYCRSIVREDADAQDALQSAFASAFVALRRGQRDAPLRPWLFRIAHNEAVSLIRRRRSDVELADAAEQWVGSAEDRAAERARLALLVADLRALPDRQLGALVMRELSGLSHEEIAIALETSVGAAKQTIFEARRALMEFAEGRSMMCEEVRRMVSDGDGRAFRSRRVRAHLRDCAGCTVFAAAIPARRDDLQALAPAASAAMLARVMGAGSGHGASGGAGAVAAGAAGKTVGATLAAKALVSAAVLATAAAGVTGVSTVLRHEHHAKRAPAGVSNARTTTGSVAAPELQPVAGARGAVAGGPRATGAHPAALGRRAARPASNTLAWSHERAPTGASPVHSRVGASGSLPAQAHGTPSASVTGGRSDSSQGVGQASGQPASIPAGGHPGATTGSHPSGSGASSHQAAGETGSPPSVTPPGRAGQSSSHGAASGTGSSQNATPPGRAGQSSLHGAGSGTGGTQPTPNPSSTPAQGPPARP
ncbi:MAG: sigma-70 family RNA polymerase sigma factor [Solirubrobacteraceae bacterium]